MSHSLENDNIITKTCLFTECISAEKCEHLISKKNDNFSSYAHNIKAVLTSTHNIGFGSEIRQSLYPSFTIYKSGV